MSDNVDALLGGEDDVGEYDLRDEEEDALLEDDSYEQSRMINSAHQDEFGDGLEESGDVLELSVEELLNEDEETDFNDSNIDDNPRDKFTNERAEAPSSSSSTAPDTTTQIKKKPVLKQHSDTVANRGRFPRRNMRGSFRGGMRGRGGQRGYQNVQNRNVKPRIEAWVKSPPQPWANGPPGNFQHQPQPVIQQWGPTTQDIQYQQIQPIQQHPQINKPPVHQRLGYSQQQHQIQPFVQPPPAMQPPPMQMQPPQQIPFEQERISNSHQLHMAPQNYMPQPQQYSQPPPVFNQPPPQYLNQNVFQSPPSYQPPPAFIPPPQQQQFVPQYNQEPCMPQQPPQQIVFQNDSSFYEPPLDNYNNGNENYHQNYNQNYAIPVYGGHQQVQRVVRTSNYPTSPQKKRRDYKSFMENNDGVQSKHRKVFGNKNLHEVQTVENTALIPSKKFEIDPSPIPDDEDEETKQYRQKIENQKRLREMLLARKEERRKLAAQQKQVEEAFKVVPSPKELLSKAPVANNVISKPSKPPLIATNPNLRVINATGDALSTPDKDQIKSFLSNRKIIAKDDSLLETSIVVVSNLAAGTSEVKLRKICSGVGDIQNFELSPKERQATIQFNSVASAHAFYKRYQRFMLDLSMIQVTLKPYS